MSMSTTDWLGTLAATLTTLSFVPQAWLILPTRNAAGIRDARARRTR
jgi:uncharacterized protein with PQ loop repeat